MDSPLYFAAGGVFGGNLGPVGLFWSPVPYGSDTAGSAYVYVGGGVYPSDYDYWYGGNSVRCILRPVVSSVSDSSDGKDLITDACEIDPTSPVCKASTGEATPCEIDPTLPACNASMEEETP